MTPLLQRMLGALHLHAWPIARMSTISEPWDRRRRVPPSASDEPSAEQLKGYRLRLLRERKLARGTVNQDGCAYRFFYGTVVGSMARHSRSHSGPHRGGRPSPIARGTGVAISGGRGREVARLPDGGLRHGSEAV